MRDLTVVGLDLSLTSTGIAAFTHGCLQVASIKSKGKRDATWGQRGLRLQMMRNEVIDEVDGFDPDLVVIESPSYGSNMAGKHDISGMWWMTVAPLLVKYPCAFVSPKARAKYGTGNGNSSKDVVQAFVHQVYTDLLCGPIERFRNDDECDATLLAAMGMRWLGAPVEPQEPDATNLSAMFNVTWPKKEDIG